MKLLWAALVLAAAALLCLPAEGKRKKKFDGDFEFAEEDELKTTNSFNGKEKKRWIHDPNSELCKPLSCKKKELCLLEDPYTAVCVSKKELHRSGDVVVPKSKLQGEEARKYSRQDPEPQDSQDDLFYDSEDDPDDSQDILAQRCNVCPVVKPSFLCGTDNRTYSTLCRLDYHNCIHHTSVKVMCKGFCPCKDLHMRKKQKQSERLNNFLSKYKATLMEESGKNKVDALQSNSIADKYTFTPQDFSYDNKHYKYIKYTKHDPKPIKGQSTYFEDKERQRGDNEVIDRKITKEVECNGPALQAIGDRLLDWFSVIMQDNKRRNNHPTRTKSLRFPAGCKNEVRWMFHHLDNDGDARLSLQELYDIEHDQSERCIKPFLDACDADRDIFVSTHEWCKCFDKTDRPCAAVKRRISTNMLGVYVPECDSEGYYYHTQCHNAVGMCWCVDKHGVEVPNSRTRGKPNCENLLGVSKSRSNKLSDDVTDDEGDDDDEDGDEDSDEVEGSADQPLDF